LIDEGGVVLSEAVGLGPCVDREVARETGDRAEQCSGKEADHVEVSRRAAGSTPLADHRKLRSLSSPNRQRTEVLLAESGDVDQASISTVFTRVWLRPLFGRTWSLSSVT
jgi:hypothetical protein